MFKWPRDCVVSSVDSVNGVNSIKKPNLNLSMFGLLFGVGILLVGCGEVGYLWQAAQGQSALIFGAKPLEQVLSDPQVSSKVKKRLELVRQVRQFATQELKLPDHGSYRKFVDVGRPYVVWNVFSAPELSIELNTSCFPIAGCVGYRGFFKEEDAKKYANAQRIKGNDVQVGGVSAYSTLGYLKDPILSTMLNYSDAVLVRTIIHEMAHGAFYVAGDTVFNESYAMAVEEEGMKRWLKYSGDVQLEREDQLEQQRSADFDRMLLSTRARLANLYEQDISNAQKRQQKQQIFEELQNAYQKTKIERWNGYNGYDAWFARSMNNAALGAVAAYAELVPDFQALLQLHQGDLSAFIAAAEACSKRPKHERLKCLRVR